MFDTDNVIKRIHFDYVLIAVTAILVMVGVIMVYSSSAVLAREKIGDGYYYLKKEIIFAVVGFALMIVVSKVPYHWWKKLVFPVIAIAFIGLILSFIPGLKSVVGGASRWIKLGPITFQPSEFAKFALIVFLAYSLEKKSSRIKSFGIGFLSHVVIAGVFIGMVLIQKDLGAAFMLAAIAGLMMLVAGVRVTYLTAAV